MSNYCFTYRWYWFIRQLHVRTHLRDDMRDEHVNPCCYCIDRRDNPYS